MEQFKATDSYKLIYVIRINSPSHLGLVKVGEATIKTDKPIDNLFPNCSLLNKVAHERIKTYTNTAGIEYELLHTELAVRYETNDTNETLLKAFSDKNVHKVLQNSGIEKVIIGDTTGAEWFRTDVTTAKDAIAAAKGNKKFLNKSTVGDTFDPIIFRPEQKEAIEKTKKVFKQGNRMLWNAKMRFGKTLSTLQIVKDLNFKRTIIVTHRPVVNDGWYNDFKKIFYNTDEFAFGSKARNITIQDLEDSCKNYVYFASVQDLRGSDKVGGKFDKNDDIFKVNWDFVVVDEAHEGTKTALGENVVAELVKDENGFKTKFLALSGTPFNIVHEYNEDELYTWDYVMEQKAKRDWTLQNFGDGNPYEELPTLNIYTYNLGKLIGGSNYVEVEDKAFNFREFFRTWTGNTSIDHKPLPQDKNIGDFVHEQDIVSFLNLITKADENTNYPYANEQFREFFNHTLWMVPGVKEAKALKEVMLKHRVFGCGLFDIVNVAGDGDKEEESKEALTSVQRAISKASKNERYTITISCGKLTTGVTIPEWTAVLMLSGSYSTSAANYLQTIFRVQSPANINGKIKDNCYVFDFAPDRTLKMVADAVNLSARAGKTSDSDRMAMGEFLNFCPVISIDGTKMQKYDENKLLQQLKRAYAERAVKSGFDDTSIYNDIELSKLTENDLKKFEELHKYVGSSKTQPKTDMIDVNKTGLTNEEYEELENSKKKPPKQRSIEEQKRLDELKEKQSNRAKAISNLRALSIRIPLLIYGADVDFDDDISAEKLVDLVDDISWQEFMPSKITKEMFKDFIKYYDTDVFIAAGRRIKSIVKSADGLSPTERVYKITELFKGFKNPDKETVLTPWRVVNMHMSDCLGGYSFYDEQHEKIIDNPRFVDRGRVTSDTFANPNSRILEINSKTGLYPLYVAYSVFRAKCKDIDQLSINEQNEIWNDTIKQNLFIICKTPMAKAITKRTLVGYNDIKVNSHSFDDLINMLKNKPIQFAGKVTTASFWGLKGNEKVKFDAIVGNPPYQETGGSGGTNDSPVYQYFASTAYKLKSEYIALIIPSRWFSGGRENLLADFRRDMLDNRGVSKLFTFTDSHDVFPAVEIKGGLCYYLYDRQHDDDCEYTIVQDNKRRTSTRRLNDFDVLIREPILAELIKKVSDVTTETVDSIISSDTPFGIPTNPKDSKKNPISVYDEPDTEHNIKLFFIENAKRKVGYIKRDNIKKNISAIDKVKVFIPKGYGAGESFPHQILGVPEQAGENSVCSQSYLYAEFNGEREADNFASYQKTKFFRALVLAVKISQDAMSKTYRFVPMQDFSKPWTDEELYKKYNLTQEEIDFIESMIKPMG